MKENKNLEDSLEETLETSDLQNLNIDLAEVTIDAIMNEGILKDIPLVGSIVSLSKFGLEVSNHLFLKKVFKFLTQLEKTTIEERKKFLIKVSKEEDYNKKVGQALLLIIDKLEDLEKPEIIGKLLVASINGELKYQDFLRLSYIVQRLFVPDIELLKSMIEGKEVSYREKEELFLSGLLITVDTGGARFDGRSEFAVGELGKKFIEILKK